jgi:hypothetical protein
MDLDLFPDPLVRDTDLNDPDPRQHVTDPQHWSKYSFLDY